MSDATPSFPPPLPFAYFPDDPLFEQPAGSAKLWRYMGLAPLLSTLRNNALHFARLDSFKDPFEASTPTGEPVPQVTGGQVLRYKDPDANKKMHLSRMRTAAACCWYLGEHESEAMWTLYATEGIAIQTTFERFVASLPQRNGDSNQHTRINVGKVKYIDFEKQPLHRAVHDGRAVVTMLDTLIHKRISFQHEQEVRALFHIFGKVEDAGEGTSVPAASIPPEGYQVGVNLRTLIEKIYVSPARPQWFADVVEDAVKRYDPGLEVVRSKLFEVTYDDFARL